MHAVLNDGHYRHDLIRLNGRVGEAQLSAVRTLCKLGLKPWLEDVEGYYLWVELPEGIDDIGLTRRAAREASSWRPDPSSRSIVSGAIADIFA